MLELFAKLDVLQADVEAIDKVLRQFAPEIEPQAIPALQSRPKADWAMKGEVVRLIFAILREAQGPLTTKRITEMVRERRGIDGEITTLDLKRVRKCLGRQREKGLIVSREGPNGFLLWMVV